MCQVLPHAFIRYGVPKGLYFSFPVTCTPGSYSIVKGLTVDKFSQEV